VNSWSTLVPAALRVPVAKRERRDRAGAVRIGLIADTHGLLRDEALAALRGSDRATPIPFGPYIAAAGWLAMLHRPQLPHRL